MEFSSAYTVIGVITLLVVIVSLYEFRIRRPDDLILFERNNQIRHRHSAIYPRHFSLRLKRTIIPIRLDSQIATSGNLGLTLKMTGSVAPSTANLDSLIRTGGWQEDTVQRAAAEAEILLQSYVRQFTERIEIQELTSAAVIEHLASQADAIQTTLGIDLVSMAIQTLEPNDHEISSALRQQEQARLMEQTERLNNQARTAAAEARFQTESIIADLDHQLGLKKAELEDELFAKQAGLAQRKLEDQLAHDRLRLAFEKEELELLKSSPELLMLTPQAARLAEASQNLKNARTVIAISPQDLARGTELFKKFEDLVDHVTEKSKPAADA